MKINPLLFVVSVVTSLVGPVSPAAADLITRFANGKIVTGGYSLHTGAHNDSGFKPLISVTDPQGDKFVEGADNGDSLQGEIFDANSSTPRIAVLFGRCVYLAGSNTIKYQTDANNKLTSITWLNVNPQALAGEKNISLTQARDQIGKALATNSKESTQDWIDRATKFLKANDLSGVKSTDTSPNLNNTIYTYDFTTHTQTVGTLDSLLIDYQFTSDQASLAYLPDGYSNIPDLTIDPLMRSEEIDDFQDSDGNGGDNNGGGGGGPSSVPEPGTLTLFAVGLPLLLLGYFRQRQLQ